MTFRYPWLSGPDQSANGGDRAAEPRSPLEFALHYAARGWYVFPLAPGSKVPATDNGAHDATRDSMRITNWWTHMPTANIGVHAGRSGLLVVDVDPRNGGDLSLEALEAAHGELPRECVQRTGGGGEHIVLSYSGGRPRKKLRDFPGIDFIWDGYIVAEPSIHPDTREPYCWLDGGESATPGACPNWLGQLLHRPAVQHTTSGNASAAITGDEWERIKDALSYLDPCADNADWFDTACALKSTGLDNEAFEIFDAWSQRCPDKYARNRGPNDTAAVWERITPDNSTRDGEPITWHTLYARATRAGWVSEVGVRASIEHGRAQAANLRAYMEAKQPKKTAVPDTVPEAALAIIRERWAEPAGEDIAQALVGWLRVSGVQPDWIRQLIDAVGAPDRRPAAEAALVRLDEGKPTLGWRALMQLIGEFEAIDLAAALGVKTEDRRGSVWAGAPEGSDLPPAPIAVQAPRKGAELLETPPAELFNLDGMLAELYGTAASSALYPQPLFNLAAAVTVVAAAIGRAYSFDGLLPNLYTVLLGPTGCGKDHPLSVLKHCMYHLSLHDRLGSDSMASWEGIEDTLLARPAQVYTLDEIGKLLKSMNARGGSERSERLAKGLLEIYTKSKSVHVPRALAGREAPTPIPHPSVSILGTSTRQTFIGALRAADAEAGFMGRLLVFSTRNGRPRKNREALRLHGIEMSDDLKDWANHLAVGVWAQQGNLATSPRPVPADEDAVGLLGALEDETDALLASLPEESVKRTVTVRRIEMLKKLALIAAVSRSARSPNVTLPDVRWAQAVTEYAGKSWVATIEDALAVSDEHEAMLKMTGYLRNPSDLPDRAIKQYRKAARRGVVPRRALLRAMNLKARDFDQLMDSLKEMDLIGEGKASLKHHLFGGLVYWATEHLEILE